MCTTEKGTYQVQGCLWIWRWIWKNGFEWIWKGKKIKMILFGLKQCSHA